MIWLLAPGASLALQAKPIKASFVLGNRAQRTRFYELLHGMKLSVPAAILVYGDKAAALRGDSNQLLRLRHRRREWFVHDHIAACFETLLCVGVVRIVRRGHYDQADGLVGKHLVE